jgi:hypothetical protein
METGASYDKQRLHKVGYSGDARSPQRAIRHRRFLLTVD